jgi:nucleoside-diphosphate-sugar epimerase
MLSESTGSKAISAPIVAVIQPPYERLEGFSGVWANTGKLEIEIRGTGHQTRSFTYIDDSLLAVQKIINSEILVPINLGSSEVVGMNRLVDFAEGIAGIRLERNYDSLAPPGV